MSLRQIFQALFTSVPRATPADYRDKIRSGAALLVDIREPAEWSGGVAESAALLPLSDLHRGRAQWAPWLAQAGGRELLLYCATGARSGMAARFLAAEGHRALNAGGLSAWAAAGWRIVSPPRAGKPQTKGKS